MGLSLVVVNLKPPVEVKGAKADVGVARPVYLEAGVAAEAVLAALLLYLIPASQRRMVMLLVTR
jgi:hypothetical protein